MTRLTRDLLGGGQPHLAAFDPDAESLTYLDPIPSYEESIAASRPGGQGNSLQILAATWGGVVVTPDIQALVQKGEGGGDDMLTLDIRTICKQLAPDPAPGQLKVLTVLYRFGGEEGKDGGGGGGGEEGMRLLSMSEDAQPSRVVITRHATAEQLAHPGQGGGTGRNRLHVKLAQPWRAAPHGEVDILAVVYGPRCIEMPTVLAQLGMYFEGRRGQIRMTNGFFGTDPWPFKRKSWSVFFQFVGSNRVQVVTGWEDSALEVPWSRQPSRGCDAINPWSSTKAHHVRRPLLPACHGPAGLHRLIPPPFDGRPLTLCRFTPAGVAARPNNSNGSNNETATTSPAPSGRQSAVFYLHGDGFIPGSVPLFRNDILRCVDQTQAAGGYLHGAAIPVRIHGRAGH